MSFTMAYYFTTFVVIGGLLMMLEAVIPVNGQCTVQGCESRDPLISIVEEIQQLRVELFDQLNKQVQGIHELLSASFQDIRSEIVKTSQQAIERRSQEQGQSIHGFLNDSLQEMKGKHDSIVTSLQAVDRRSQEQGQSIHGFLNDSLQEIKSKHDRIMASLQAVDRRSQEQEICIKQGQTNHEFLNESFQEIKAGQIGSVKTILQAVDRRSQEHDNCTRQGQDIRQLFNESFQVVDQRLQEHDISLKNRTHNLWALANEMKSQHDAALTSLQAIDRRLQEHDDYMKNHSQNMWKLAYGICRSASGVCDCSDIKASGQTATGVYEVCVGNQTNRTCSYAFCDMETANRPSLVFQRRKDGSVSFNRTWTEYEEGFGNRNGEFWLGNEMLHLLTSRRNYKLRVDLEDFQGNRGLAEYTRVFINSSDDKYRLTVSGYSGNAGDSLAWHNNHQFSTQDLDNGADKATVNCAQRNGGGWWFYYCFESSLNGIYYNPARAYDSYTGIHWTAWRGVSLKATEMKLIPLA